MPGSRPPIPGTENKSNGVISPRSPLAARAPLRRCPVGSRKSQWGNRLSTPILYTLVVGWLSQGSPGSVAILTSWERAKRLSGTREFPADGPGRPVPELCQNPICLGCRELLFEREQLPQVVDNRHYRIELIERLEPVIILRNQQVAGSIPAGGSIPLIISRLPSSLRSRPEDFDQQISSRRRSKYLNRDSHLEARSPSQRPNSVQVGFKTISKAP